MKKEDCIFCKIANGDIPSKTLYEDEDFRVILDLGPATKGHALILPKEHADNLYELPDETASKSICPCEEACDENEGKIELRRLEYCSEQWRSSWTDSTAFSYASDSPLCE